MSASTQGLRDMGVSIYVIGVGDKVKVPELMDLTSDYRNVFTADDFHTLHSKGRDLAEIIKNESSAAASNGTYLIVLLKTGISPIKSVQVNEISNYWLLKNNNGDLCTAAYVIRSNLIFKRIL